MGPVSLEEDAQRFSHERHGLEVVCIGEVEDEPFDAGIEQLLARTEHGVDIAHDELGVETLLDLGRKVAHRPFAELATSARLDGCVF